MLSKLTQDVHIPVNSFLARTLRYPLATALLAALLTIGDWPKTEINAIHYHNIQGNPFKFMFLFVLFRHLRSVKIRCRVVPVLFISRSKIEVVDASVQVVIIVT